MNVHFIGGSLFDNSASIQDVVKFLSREKVVGIDIETSRKFKRGQYKEEIYAPGLDPRVSRIVMLQVGNTQERYVIDVRSVDITPIIPFFQSDILWVGANLKFECKHFLHNFGVSLKNVWDVMIADIILWNGYRFGFSLKEIAKRYLDVFDAGNVDLFSLDNYNKFMEKVWQEADKFLIDKSTAREFINIGDRPFTKKQIEYGADDIILPLKIYEQQKFGRYVNGEIYRPEVIEVENRLVPVLADMEYVGIPFRADMWVEVAKKAEVDMMRQRDKLDKYVQENHHEFCVASLDLFSPDRKCAIQWSSAKQVLPLFKKLGVAAQEKRKATGKVTDSVGEKALINLLDLKHKKDLEDQVEYDIGDPMGLVVQYLIYKHYEQLVKTFGRSYLKYVHPITGRIHCNFFQIVSTGRMSANKPNTMQLPSKPEYRDCFMSGKRIVGADFAGQEIRALAHLSKVEPMRSFFQTFDPVFGDDFHSYTATLIERLRTGDQSIVCTKKTHPEQRHRAKTVNFAVSYGASAVSLAAQFGSTIEEAEQFLMDYFEAWDGMVDYRKATMKAVSVNGYINIDPYGRRWFYQHHQKMLDAFKEFSDALPQDYRNFSPEERVLFKEQLYSERPDLKAKIKWAATERGKLERKALNYPIQGTSGTMLKLALLKVHETVKSLGIPVSIINAVHDEILLECEEQHAEFAAKLLSTAMEQAGAQLCDSVPFVADSYIDVKWKK